MNPEQEMSLSQLYKKLHISKRKAAWMLQNGIIPCKIRDSATHKYVIRIDDVEEYLKKSELSRRAEIPVGIFNGHPLKRKLSDYNNTGTFNTTAKLYLSLTDEKREEFSEFLEKRLSRIGDAISVATAAKTIGYTGAMIIRHINRNDLSAYMMSGKYVIPKTELIRFLASDVAFLIVHKSAWHKRTIMRFIEK